MYADTKHNAEVLVAPRTVPGTGVAIAIVLEPGTVSERVACTATSADVALGIAPLECWSVPARDHEHARELANATWTQVIEARNARQSHRGRPSKPATEPGVYRRGDGQVFAIVISRETGRPYAKRVDDETGKHVYAPGAMRTLTEAMRLTAEVAEALAIAKGWTTCCVCGRLLTAKDSVAVGIGPICRDRL